MHTYQHHESNFLVIKDLLTSLDVLDETGWLTGRQYEYLREVEIQVGEVTVMMGSCD